MFKALGESETIAYYIFLNLTFLLTSSEFICHNQPAITFSLANKNISRFPFFFSLVCNFKPLTLKYILYLLII